MSSTKLTGLFRLFRFELPFAAGTCVLLGELLALGTMPSPVQAVFGFLSFFFVSATALVLNDYFDVETDRINAPSRPIPSGLVTKAEALSLSIVVALLAFMCSYLVSPAALAVVVPIWLLGVLYNWRLKRTGIWGNLVVAFSVGMTFIFGGVVAGNPFEPVVLYLAFTVMFIDLGEEVAADVLDVEGDRKTGSRSLAVLWGPERAMRFSAGVFGIVVAGSAVPFIFGWLEWIYLIPLAILDGIIIFSVRKLLDPSVPKRLNYIRVIYLGGLAAMVLLIVIRLSTA